jgi:hypothetical protein
MSQEKQVLNKLPWEAFCIAAVDGYVENFYVYGCRQKQTSFRHDRPGKR